MDRTMRGNLATENVRQGHSTFIPNASEEVGVRF